MSSERRRSTAPGLPFTMLVLASCVLYGYACINPLTHVLRHASHTQTRAALAKAAFPCASRRPPFRVACASRDSVCLRTNLGAGQLLLRAGELPPLSPHVPKQLILPRAA